jgi:hypothetical protein
MSGRSDASDTIRRRKQRTLFADKAVQETALANGIKNNLILEGGLNNGSLSYNPNFNNIVNGETQTTPEELVAYKASATPSPPDAPYGATARAGDELATVTFTPPPNVGSSPITSFAITSSPGNITATGTSTPITITGLTNGTAYTFTVTATNNVGSSEPSPASNSVTPSGVPFAPTITSVTHNGGTVDIYFNPGGNNGSTITNYEYSLNNGTSWVPAVPATTSSPIIIQNTTAESTYYVRIRAVSLNGKGQMSNLYFAVSLIPLTPVHWLDGNDASTVIQSGGVVTAWNDKSGASRNATAVTTGTGAITYDSVNKGIVFSGNSSGNQEYFSTTSATNTLYKLTPFTIFAVETRSVTEPTGTFYGSWNTIGTNNLLHLNYQSNFTSLRFGFLANDQDYNSAELANSRRRLWAFRLPAAGSRTIRYFGSVVSTLGNVTQLVSNANTIQIGRFRTQNWYNGTLYEIIGFHGDLTDAQVQQMEGYLAWKWGLQSDLPLSHPYNPNAVSPAPTVPAAPTILEGTSGDSQITISFVPGNNGGLPITNYEYSTNDGISWTACNPPTIFSPIIITGLTNGVAYKVKLRAVNSVGSGAASSTLYITPLPFSNLMLLMDAANYTSGSKWFDYSGKSMHATLFNSPIWSSANGGRFEFNGTNQYAQLPIGFADFTSGITVLAIADFGIGNSSERIIDFGNGQANNNILLARNGTTQSLTFEVYNNIIRIIQPNFVTNNSWSYYGGSLNGTTSAIINTNNIIMPGTIVSGSMAGLPLNVTRTLNYIGRSNWSGDSYFQRYIGVVAIFNRALTGSEITAFLDFYRNRYLPAAPTGLSATAGNAQATISFTPGSDNGTPITNYQYSTDGVNYTALSPADALSPITITGLTNGITYNITLKAVNAFGASLASGSVSVTPV